MRCPVPVTAKSDYISEVSWEMGPRAYSWAQAPDLMSKNLQGGGGEQETEFISNPIPQLTLSGARESLVQQAGLRDPWSNPQRLMIMTTKRYWFIFHVPATVLSSSGALTHAALTVLLWGRSCVYYCHPRVAGEENRNLGLGPRMQDRPHRGCLS